LLIKKKAPNLFDYLLPGRKENEKINEKNNNSIAAQYGLFNGFFSGEKRCTNFK
jgi:hypothetical protein